MFLTFERDSGLALAALIGAGSLFPLIDKEFMPIMDEGTTVVIIEKLPSISLVSDR